MSFHAPSIRGHRRIAALRGRLRCVSGSRDPIRENIESTLRGWPEFPDIEAVVRRTREFAAVSRLAGTMPRMRGFRDPRCWPIQGREHLDTALAGGRGAVIVTAHFGFGLLLGPILRLHGVPAVQVMVEYVHRAERERTARWSVDGSRFRAWMYQRTRVVAELLSPEDLVAGLDVRPIFRALAQNRPVLLAGDGRRAARFVELPLLGRPYPLPTGSVEIALRAGCPALPAFVPEQGPGGEIRVEIGPPLGLDPERSVAENVALYARVLDARLRKAPHLWTRWSIPRLFEDARRWSESDFDDRYGHEWEESN